MAIEDTTNFKQYAVSVLRNDLCNPLAGRFPMAVFQNLEVLKKSIEHRFEIESKLFKEENVYIMGKKIPKKLNYCFSS